MVDFDNKIQKVLKKEINKPLSYNFAIKNAFLKKKKSNNYVIKIITSVACLTLLCTSVIAASYTIYKKVWKEPSIINEKEIENEVKSEITDEEKADFVQENEIINKAYNVMQILDVNEEIISVTLSRGYDIENGYHYIIKTNNILLQFNPKNSELEYYCNNDVIAKAITCDQISEEQANEIANRIYGNLSILQDNDEYEIIESKIENIAGETYTNKMWVVSYAKKINEYFDEDSKFSICFAVVDGKTEVYILKGKTTSENNEINNPIIITEEEAINIAVEKEKEFSSLMISEINANLSIEKMNIFIYALENNITNEDGSYQVDNISRNVWVVEIKHSKDTKPRDSKIETVKQLYDKKYYIDATTGEIIGGEQAEIFND